MRFKKLFPLICIVICLFTVASVCASEVNDTAITAVDSNENLEIDEYDQIIDKYDSLGVEDLNNNESTKESNIEIPAQGTDGNADSDKLGIPDDNIIGDDLRANVTALNVSAEDNTMFVVDCADGFNGNVSIKVGNDELYDGSVKALIEAAKLPAGNHVATALFYGDVNYENLTLNDIRFTVSRVTPTIDVDINDITYPGSAYASVHIGNNANGTVNVTVDGATFNGAVHNGYAIVAISGLAAGYKVAKIEFFSTDDYNNNVNSSAKFIIFPNNSLIEISGGSTFHVGEDIEVKIKTINSTGDLTVYINGEQYLNVFYPDHRNKELIISDKSEGTYVIDCRLEGDENFTGYSTSKTVQVVKNDIYLYVQEISEDIRVNAPVTFTAKLNNTVTGNVIFTINGANYTEHVDNDDKVDHIYTPSNNDTLRVVATFMGNERYNANVSNSKYFNVDRISTEVYVDVYPIVAGDDANFYVTLVPEINAIVKLSVADKSYDVAIVDGQGMYTVSNLANDVYNIQAVFEGDDKYEDSSSDVKQLFVNKVPTNLTISIDKTSMNYIEKAVVSVVLNQRINAIVTVKVNGNNNTVGLVNGKGSFTLYDLDRANYTINAVFAGDDRYVDCTSNTLNLTVNGDNISSWVSISLNKPSVFVGDEVTITVNSNPSVTGIIKLNIGSNSYDVAVKRGVGKFTIDGLANGTYDVQAVFEGDNYHLGNSSDVKQLEVKRIPTDLSISVDKPSVFVGDSVVIGVVLNQSINTVATVNVNGKEYIIGIVNGKGNLTLGGLAFGTYNINATFAGEDKYVGSVSNNTIFEVNKIETQLSGDAITVIYNTDKYLVIALKDSKGNAIGNVDVTVNLNGAKTLKTDGNGQVKVSTNGLAPNSYTAKIIFKGNAMYEASSKDVKVAVNKATPKITAKAKKFKKSVKTKKYTVTLNVNQKVRVAIKVNKKTYYAYTNTKGVATFKITKLTKKGKYTATVSSLTNKCYNKAKSVRVKITVK